MRHFAKNAILLKNPMNASTRLSMNGKSPMISTAPPFVLRLSKDERRVFQQNRMRGQTLRFAYDRRAGIKRCLGECLVPRWNFTSAVAIFHDAGAEALLILGDDRIEPVLIHGETQRPHARG